MKPWGEEFEEYYKKNHKQLFRNPTYEEDAKEIWNAAVKTYQSACITAIAKIGPHNCLLFKSSNLPIHKNISFESIIRRTIVVIKKIVEGENK